MIRTLLLLVTLTVVLMGRNHLYIGLNHGTTAIATTQTSGQGNLATKVDERIDRIPTNGLKIGFSPFSKQVIMLHYNTTTLTNNESLTLTGVTYRLFGTEPKSNFAVYIGPEAISGSYKTAAAEGTATFAGADLGINYQITGYLQFEGGYHFVKNIDDNKGEPLYIDTLQNGYFSLVFAF